MSAYVCVRMCTCVLATLQFYSPIPGHPMAQLHVLPRPASTSVCTAGTWARRLYKSQPLLSDECPPICSTGSLALAGCALCGNNILDIVSFIDRDVLTNDPVGFTRAMPFMALHRTNRALVMIVLYDLDLAVSKTLCSTCSLPSPSTTWPTHRS